MRTYSMQRSLLEKFTDNRRLKRMLKDLPESSTIKYKNVKNFTDKYRMLFSINTVICQKLSSNLHLENHYSPTMLGPATLILNYLLERVVTTPFHVLNTLTWNPMYAHSDIAALNRGLFEAAVNSCYLSSKDCEQRLKENLLMSIQREHQLHKSMNKWVDSEDPKIKRVSTKQLNTKNAPNAEQIEEIKELIGDVGKFPNLWERCQALGEDWMFAYDSKYRGLSSWQHGDMSRAYTAHVIKEIDPLEAERPIFESMVQCSWAWDIVFTYATTLQRICNSPKISDQLTYLNHISVETIEANIDVAIKKFQG